MISATLGVVGLIAGVLLTIYLTRHLIYKKIDQSAEIIEKALDANQFPDLHKIDPNFQRLNAATRHAIEKIRNKESEVDRQSGRGEAVLANLDEGVIALGIKNKILLFNDGAARLFQVKTDKVLQKPIIEIVRNSAIVQLIERANPQNTKVTDVVEIQYPNHKFLKIDVTDVSKTQKDIKKIMVVNDVTEMRRLENLRRDFVANVSHELKTPLTSIKGFTETLLTSSAADFEKSRTFLKLMGEDIERLERLINGLLDLSKIESSGVVRHVQAIDFYEEIERTVSAFESRIKLKQLKIKNQLPKNKTVQLLIDLDRLRQVLINLIDNAIKFNRDGGQIIFVMNQDDKYLSITIEDTGIGISPKDVTRIFERFYRADKARAHEAEGGTGLGLAIVKHIIESHGGQISCTSTIDKSSYFRFTLPLTSSV